MEGKHTALGVYFFLDYSEHNGAAWREGNRKSVSESGLNEGYSTTPPSLFPSQQAESMSSGTKPLGKPQWVCAELQFYPETAPRHRVPFGVEKHFMQ